MENLLWCLQMEEFMMDVFWGINTPLFYKRDQGEKKEKI